MTKLLEAFAAVLMTTMVLAPLTAGAADYRPGPDTVRAAVTRLAF